MGENDFQYSLILWSLFVIVLAVIFFLLFRRFTKSHWISPKTGLIKVIEHKRLSNLHELYLVEVAKQMILIGATKDRMVKLAILSHERDLEGEKVGFNQDTG